MPDDRRTVYQNVAPGLAVVGSLLALVLGFILYDSRQTTWTHAVETSSNLVTALQRDIGRTIETYDLSLKAALRARRAPELSPQTRQLLLFDGAVEARHMGSVFVLDATGHIVDDSGNLTPTPGSLADQDFFTVHRDRSDVGLYIGKPFKNSLNHQWMIGISRRITGPGGGFEGVVAGAIRFAYFAELFSKLDLGPGGGISLFNLDGTLLYRAPFSASQIGHDFSDASLFREIRAGHTAPYEGVGRVDGVSRLFAFAIIDGLPLVLSVNTAVSTIYAEWLTKAVLTGLVCLVLMVIGLLLTRAAQAELRRRLAAERQTVRSAKMLTALFEHSPDGLFVIGVMPDGRFVYESYNQACAILTGLGESEGIGKGPQDVYSAEVAAALEQRYRTCVQSGRTYSYEESRLLPAGRRDWHSVLSPIADENGVVTLIIGSARDMTELNKRTEERHRSSKMEAVGRLTAGVAHNFNNQLQTISSSLEILEADFLADTEAAEYGELARQATQVSAKLTHGLLAFSRQQVLRPQRINVANLLIQAHQAAGPAKFRPGIHGKFVVEAFTDDIHADPAQAEGCLLSLISNACEAMPEGGSLVVHARNAGPSDGVCGVLQPENIVIIAVQDTGCGMDAAVRARAFEPFFTTKKFGKESGLGLSMAQGFCHQSGGDIRILSGGQAGTRIEIWLPAATANKLAGDDIGANLATIGRPTGRVLLADNDHESSAALIGSLVAGGFEVVTVTNGDDGLARLGDREPYDAVLSGADLTDMTGVAFLNQIGSRAPSLSRLLLANPDDGKVLTAHETRSMTVLCRPVHRTDLLAAVREAIGETRSVHLA